MNRITLIGNVGKEPEIRTLESGAKVAVFTLATKDRAFTLPNGTQVPERTEWHNLVLWKGYAEVAESYIHKGDNSILRVNREQDLMMERKVRNII